MLEAAKTSMFARMNLFCYTKKNNNNPETAQPFLILNNGIKRIDAMKPSEIDGVAIKGRAYLLPIAIVNEVEGLRHSLAEAIDSPIGIVPALGLPFYLRAQEDADLSFISQAVRPDLVPDVVEEIEGLRRALKDVVDCPLRTVPESALPYYCPTLSN